MKTETIVPTVARDRFTLLETHSHARAADFADDVRAGLTHKPKRLSCRYLYDHEGSRLFEQICELPEYYLTRTELALLQQHAAAIIGELAPETWLVELGSGSARKTRVLIEALLQRHGRLCYVPIDISRSMLHESSHALLADYPGLEVLGVAAEYRAGLRLLHDERARPKLILWLGSNVGNFTRAEAAAFLEAVRDTMSPPDRLLVGIDLRKSRAILEPAYDDAAGVTASFNRNLLQRINRELGGHFDLRAFAHRAHYREALGRVELYLVSLRAQTVRIDALDLRVDFAEGETIFTESSYKYGSGEIDQLARAGGLAVEQRWIDDGGRFSLNLLAPQSG